MSPGWVLCVVVSSRITVVSFMKPARLIPFRNWVGLSSKFVKPMFGGRCFCFFV